MRNATRNDLFPTAEMIVSLSKEFGVPLTAADFEGKVWNTNLTEGFLYQLKLMYSSS